MDIDLSEQRDLLDALEARTFVYLQSFIKMTHPLRQTRIEAKDLELQWTRLCRGKQQALDHDFYFVEKHHIIEYGLENGFVVRLDLATFAHEVFTPTLDLKRCKRAFEGFIELFLIGKEPLVDPKNAPQKAIFIQLVAIILALQVRQSLSSSRKVSQRSIEAACNTKNIPEITKLTKMNLTPMFELATRVANDEKQRLDLFGDTLKQIKEQIHLKMKPLAPIANKELAREQQEAREKDIAALYKNQLDGDQGEHNHAPWLPLEDPQDEGEKDGTDVAQKDVVQKDINQKEVGQKDVNHKNVAQKDIAQEASEQDTANSGKASGRKMDKAQAHTPSSRTPLSRAAKDSRKETTTSSKPSSDRTTRTADKEVVTTRSNSSPSNMTKETIRNATTTPSKASSNDTTKDADKETPVTLTRKRPSLDRAAKDNVKRARSGEAASDSDFDLGDDLPAPVSENIEHDLIDDSIEPSEVSDSVNKQRITDEASTGTDAAAAPTATPTGSTDIHVRKKTRHWSHAEEERLQELVPQFLYKEGEAKNKKRTIKWAKLKAHDQAYGDILKHRTQIMLKDKYRDLTDGGQHRKFVSELYRKQRDVSKTQETE